MTGFYGPINGYRTAADPAWLGERDRQRQTECETEKQRDRESQRQTDRNRDRDREILDLKAHSTVRSCQGECGQEVKVIMLCYYLHGCMVVC